MADQILLMRHAGYILSGERKGMPLVSHYVSPGCFDPLFLTTEIPYGTRQVGYVIDGPNKGLPVNALASSCCPPLLENCGNVEFDIAPFGIPVFLQGYVNETNSCVSAQNREILFTYCGPTSGGEGACSYGACPELPVGCGCDPLHGRWLGSLELAGGTLNFTLCFVRVDDQLSITLCYTGCATGTAGGPSVSCSTPIVVDGIQFSIGFVCCGCNPDGSEPGSIVFTLRGGCVLPIVGRHVGYRGGKPLIAMENCNLGDIGEPLTCNPKCALNFSLGGCCSDSGVFPYTFIEGIWESGFDCHDPLGPPGLITMTCVAVLNPDGTQSGFTRLEMQASCGVTESGSAFVIIPNEDFETLDVTFNIPMSSPAEGCLGGQCLYAFIPMLGIWQLISDDCEGDCDPCPEEGSGPTSPCSGEPVAGCCGGGTLVVHVTR